MIPLTQRSVLIVDDEALVRILIEDMLIRLGFSEIRHAVSLSEAHKALDAMIPDLAVLDVYLDGETVYPIAARLEAAGKPFVFATGFGRKGMLDPWASREVLHKPFSSEALHRALLAVTQPERA